MVCCHGVYGQWVHAVMLHPLQEGSSLKCNYDVQFPRTVPRHEVGNKASVQV